MGSFLQLAELCEKLHRESRRKIMVSMVAEFLKGLSEDEVEWAVRLITGRVLPVWDPRKLDVSYATIVKVVLRLTGAAHDDFIKAYNQTGDTGSAAWLLLSRVPSRQRSLLQAPLTILDVRELIDGLASAVGPGSRVKKERLLEAALGRANPLEAKYLINFVGGEVRYGFKEGLMEEAIAKAFGVEVELVRRANFFLSDLGLVAKLAKAGRKKLEEVGIVLFRPLKPMLAEMAQTVQEALEEHGGVSAFEQKLDGARVQIHKLGSEVRIFSRRLSDVTRSLPEVVKLVSEEVKAHDAILEGEVIAVDENGRPRPFQHLMRRFRRIREVERMAEEVQTRLILFDVLYANGAPLIDRPYRERREILASLAGSIPLTESIVTSDPSEAERFFERAIASGHEGLMAKQPDSPYTPGTRGKRWLKLKRVLETLDLVIVAADYGHGYRHRWLSDYYLAARDERTGEFLVIGKCYTGLTDQEIEQMTERLKRLAIGQRGRTVIVKPEVVVEVAFAEVQRSPHYKSGYALRFARILRIRDDKSPEEADTIQRVERIFESQFRAKAR